MNASTRPEFFESMYQECADPWNFATSEYEQQRYAAIVSALSLRRYRRVFEPGCSIGVLTAKLATLCDELIAIDVSPSAVHSAQNRCRGFLHVQVEVGGLPCALPDGSFDLIVLSEIGYYFEEQALAEFGAVLVNRLEPGGDLLAVHWLGNSNDHILTGRRVHQILSGINGMHHQYSAPDEGFRLEKWVRL